MMQAIFETLFDIIYLLTVITLGILMIRASKGRKQYSLYGAMAVILGCGDAFHLVPRAIALCTTGLETYTVPLGIGKMVTSITMTLFYVLLYYVWRCRYQIKDKKELTIIVWILSIARIFLCLMPQNAWTSAEAPLSWGIYRNIPFVILGVLIVILFYTTSKKEQDKLFCNLWLAVVISFGCYIPLVLFADTIPPVGMLMIRRSRGMFCVSSVCLPGPNKSSACPFRKKIASCDSCTINCVVVLKSSQGCFHMKVLLSPSYLMMSAISAMTPPPSIFYCVLLQIRALKYTLKYYTPKCMICQCVELNISDDNVALQ